MKNILPFFWIIFYILAGCSKESLTVQFQRNPLIKFDTDSSSWTADSYFFTGPAKVVVYPSDTTLAGTLYNRFILQATGKDSKNNPLQLNLTFDVAETTQLAGMYNTSYTIDKGLQQVQLFNTGASLEAFQLCPPGSISPMLQIQKQSVAERLITGTFQMTLCNARDTTQKIHIKNGIITDIHY